MLDVVKVSPTQLRDVDSREYMDREAEAFIEKLRASPFGYSIAVHVAREMHCLPNNRVRLSSSCQTAKPSTKPASDKDLLKAVLGGKLPPVKHNLIIQKLLNRVSDPRLREKLEGMKK